jgi:hypothetical protein
MHEITTIGRFRCKLTLHQPQPANRPPPTVPVDQALKVSDDPWRWLPPCACTKVALIVLAVTRV